jgi:hypothetical protein
LPPPAAARGGAMNGHPEFSGASPAFGVKTDIEYRFGSVALHA